MEPSITHLNNTIHSPCCKPSNKFGWVRDGQQLLFAHKLVPLTSLSTCASKIPIFPHKHSSHWLDKLDITANSVQNLTLRSIVESFDRQRTISFCKAAASEATSNSLASSSEIRLETSSVSALAPADLADADVRSVSISRRAESRRQWFKTFFPFVTDATTIKASLTSFFSLA